MVRGVRRWRRYYEVAVFIFETLRAFVGDSQVKRFICSWGAKRARVLDRRRRGGREAARRRVLFAHGDCRARAHRARAPPTCNKIKLQVKTPFEKFASLV